MFETDEEFDFSTDLAPFSPKSINNKRPALLENFETKKPKISERNLPRNVIKRKFPGPAGVLPGDNNLNTQFRKSDTDNDFVPYSQASFSEFQEGPWAVMTDDFGAFTDQYDIKWIESRAGSSKLVNQKAPFLAAIIQSIECLDGNGSNAKVTLKDMSGAIQGSIVHELYEEHSENLTLGSVIVLRQFGVLTTGCNKKHYLVITPNNLAAIYKNCAKGESTVKKIDLQTINFSELPLEGAKTTINLSELPLEGAKTAESIRGDGSDSVGVNLEDDLGIPDNFEEIALKEHKKFRFKAKTVDKEKGDRDDVTVSCSQVSVKTSLEHSGIWQDALDGVDMDSLFEDF